MILVDPDLDSDRRFQRSNSEGIPPILPTAGDRNLRVPSVRTVSRFLTEAQAAVRLRGEVAVLLTTDAQIRRLNRQFRGKNKPTDVLSFPADPEVRKREGICGDLAISVPTALRQAREHGHSLGVELKVLILHGLLHLVGFDHESDDGEMAGRERLLRARLGLAEGLIERVNGGKTSSGLKRRPLGKRRKAGASTPLRSAPEDKQVSKRRSARGRTA